MANEFVLVEGLRIKAAELASTTHPTSAAELLATADRIYDWLTKPNADQQPITINGLVYSNQR
jgi:hypothetical protein